MLEVYKVIRNELHSIGFNPSHPLVSSTFDRLDVQRSTLGEDKFLAAVELRSLKIFCLAALTSSEPPSLAYRLRSVSTTQMLQSHPLLPSGVTLSKSPVKHLNIQESAITSQKSTSPPQKAERRPRARHLNHVVCHVVPSPHKTPAASSGCFSMRLPPPKSSVVFLLSLV